MAKLNNGFKHDKESCKKIIDWAVISSFIACPRMFHLFGDAVSHRTAKSEAITFSREYIEELLVWEMEKARGNKINRAVPDSNKVNRMINAKLNRMKELGISLKRINSVTSSLLSFNKRLYKMYSKGWIVASARIPVSFDYAGLFYKDFIDGILVSVEEVMPIIVTHRTFSLNYKDNKYRFAAAALKHLTKARISQFLEVKISDEPFNVSMTIKDYNKGEIERSLDELKSVLSSIADGYNIPNTLYCDRCNFSLTCEL